MLRRAPIDAFQQVAELGRRDRHRAVRRRRPDEAAAFQALREQAHALPIVPKHLEQSAPTAAKNKKMTAMRILLQLLLNHQGQAVEALTHVRMAGRKPHPYAGRKRDHRRRSPWASAATAADIVPASTEPVIRSRAPFAN